jgi:hypothetical protein
MVIRENLTAILEKKMDRREFIKQVGIGLLALTGLSAALKIVTPTTQPSQLGYGSSAYGGMKKE